MPEEKSIRIVLDKEELGTAQKAAREAKVDLQITPEPEFIDPITAVLVGGGLIAIGKFVFDFIDRARGGVIIDLQPGAKYFIRRDKSVPYGWAVIKAADGKSVKIEVHDAPRDGAERLLRAIIDGVLKNSQDIVKEAKKELVKVEEQPAAAT